jgi:hypothetical protein
MDAAPVKDIWGNSAGYTHDTKLTIINLQGEANPPVFSEFTADKTAVDVTNGSETLTFTYRIQDESGIVDPIPYDARCSLSYGNRYIDANDLTQRISGNNKDGIYTCSFTITTSAVPGEYKMDAAPVKDIWGNSAGYTHDTKIEIINRNAN